MSAPHTRYPFSRRRESMARYPAGQRRRDVPDVDGAVLRLMPADPPDVVVPERRAGDDEEALLLQPGHGEVALDAAPTVQHRGVRDGADRPVHVVVAQPLEEP